jgi:WhiB family redox-sensing transcriptional regulator
MIIEAHFLITRSSRAWMSRGACLDADPELFFLDPEDSATHRAEKAEQARKICDICPVKVECLLWGLLVSPDDEWSIFGGTTYQQRRQIRRDLG